MRCQGREHRACGIGARVEASDEIGAARREVHGLHEQGVPRLAECCVGMQHAHILN